MQTQPITRTTHSPDQTEAVGLIIGKRAKAGDLILLDGMLGAGKTQLVRGIALGMGMDPTQVASPTYVLVHEYTNAKQDKTLVHIDAYRIAGPEDLQTIGYDELRQDAVVVVEWASKIKDFLEANADANENDLHVQLEHAGEQERILQITAHGQDWRGRLNQTFDP